jgi:hypothetical protein
LQANYYEKAAEERQTMKSDEANLEEIKLNGLGDAIEEESETNKKEIELDSIFDDNDTGPQYLGNLVSQPTRTAFNSFEKPDERELGAFLPLQCGHNGYFSQSERRAYELHLLRSGFINERFYL